MLNWLDFYLRNMKKFPAVSPDLCLSFPQAAERDEPTDLFCQWQRQRQGQWCRWQQDRDQSGHTSVPHGTYWCVCTEAHEVTVVFLQNERDALQSSYRSKKYVSWFTGLTVWRSDWVKVRLRKRKNESSEMADGFDALWMSFLKFSGLLTNLHAANERWIGIRSPRPWMTGPINLLSAWDTFNRNRGRKRDLSSPYMFILTKPHVLAVQWRSCQCGKSTYKKKSKNT